MARLGSRQVGALVAGYRRLNRSTPLLIRFARPNLSMLSRQPSDYPLPLNRLLVNRAVRDRPHTQTGGAGDAEAYACTGATMPVDSSIACGL